MFKDFGVTIEEDEGFSKNDIFNHAPFGRRLANLLSNTNHPLTVAIDGQWGEGKTTFLKMWASQLRKDGYPVIEFDAFANDYYDDPFIPLAGEIVTLAKSNRAVPDTFVDKAAKVGTALVKGGLKVGVKAITMGALDGKMMDDITSEIADGLADYTEKQVEDLISDHFQQKGQFEAFKEALSRLPSQLSEAPKSEDDHPINPKPLIFIIDELDRCRPDYALKLLERIKHFFSAPNIHFVFGVHMLQLENSVKAMYGHDIDAKLYLQKFFSISTNIPTTDTNTNRHNILIYCINISKKYNFSFMNSDGNSEIINFFINKKLSLRQIEKFFHEFSFVHQTRRNSSLNAYLAILLAIKKYDQSNYIKIIGKNFNFESANNLLNQFFGSKISAEWQSFIAGILAESDLSKITQSFNLYNNWGEKGLNYYLDEKFLHWVSYLNDQ